MCLRFVFLLITSVVSWLRLSRREEAWQTAEILILRHQLAVVQRRQPRRPIVSWADRALLAILQGVIPSAVQTPRMNAIAERWIAGCRHELLDRTLIWNQAHLRRILHTYETHHNEHRPHRSLGQAAPLKPLPGALVDLDAFRCRRRDLIGGVIHEYAHVA